jgi:broad specificity phosphatase PhoE
LSGKEIQNEWAPHGVKVSESLLSTGDAGWYAHKQGKETHTEAEARAAGVCKWLWSEAAASSQHTQASVSPAATAASTSASEVDLCLVLHGDLLGLLLRGLLECGPKPRFLHLNTAYTMVELNPSSGSASLLYHNRVSHLEASGKPELFTGAEMMRVIA